MVPHINQILNNILGLRTGRLLNIFRLSNYCQNVKSHILDTKFSTSFQPLFIQLYGIEGNYKKILDLEPQSSKNTKLVCIWSSEIILQKSL